MTASAQTVNALYLIDSRISLADRERLIAGLPFDGAWSVLDEAHDGLSQIRDTVANYSGLGALHLFGFGAPGSLLLGSSEITTSVIGRAGAQLAQIGQSLSPGGDILIYGCDVAQGAAGQAYIQELARLTEADIAASTNRTGAQGDWTLEAHTGPIETGTLAADGFETTLDGVGFGGFATVNHMVTLSGTLNLDVTARDLEVQVGGKLYKKNDGSLVVDPIARTWSLAIADETKDLALASYAVKAWVIDAKPVAPVTVALNGSGSNSVNLITGTAGSDVFVGRSDTRSDIASFNGTRSDFSVRVTQAGLTVTDNRVNGGAQATDTLSNIHLIKFTDSAVPEFILAAAPREALSGQTDANLISVNASKLYNGTQQAETFVISKNVSAMILAGAGDVIELRNRVTDYSYSAMGSQLQINDGSYITTVNIGGAVTLRTASGSTTASLGVNNGALEIKLGSQLVGSPAFDPALTIAPNSSVSSNSLVLSKTVSPIEMNAAESMTLYLVNQARHDPQAWAKRLGIDLYKDSAGNLIAGLNGLGAIDAVVPTQVLLKVAREYSALMRTEGKLEHDLGPVIQRYRVFAAGYSTEGLAFAENLNYRSSANAFSDEQIARYSVEDLFKDVNEPGASHRAVMLSDLYSEFGVGYEVNSTKTQFYGTENFATNARTSAASYLCGFILNDLNGNSEYNVGEGLGGVTVTVKDSKGKEYQTTSLTHGYWLIQVPDNDSYTVTASGGAYAGTSTVTTTVQAADTVTVDFISGQSGAWVDYARDVSETQTQPENSDWHTTIVWQPPGAVAPGSIFQLGGLDADAFSMDASTGVVQFRASPDYETRQQYEYEVTQWNQGRVVYSRTFTLNISNVNEAPQGVALRNTVTLLNEGVSVRTKVADLTILDDSLGNNQLALGGADAENFELVDRALYFKVGVALNYAQQARYDVSIQVRDPDLNITAGTAFLLKVNTNDYKLAVPDVQGEVRTMLLAGMAQSNLRPIGFAATRFDTALVVSKDTSTVVRIVDLQTGSLSPAQTLALGESVVALPGTSSQFAIASFNNGSIVLTRQDMRAGMATPATLTLDNVFRASTQTAAGTWDFPNSDGTYLRLNFTSATAGTLKLLNASTNALIGSDVAIPTTTSTTADFLNAFTRDYTGQTVSSFSIAGREVFMLNGTLHLRETVNFTASRTSGALQYIKYITYANNAWATETQVQYENARNTHMVAPRLGAACNYYVQGTGGENYFLTSGASLSSATDHLYVFKNDANTTDTAYQAAAVYQLPVNDRVNNMVFASGTVWIDTVRYDAELGGQIRTCYSLMQREWRQVSESAYDNALSTAMKPGSVARMGADALDLLSYLPLGESTKLLPQDVTNLGNGQFLIRADVNSPSVKTGYEYWFVYDATSHQLLSSKAFSANDALSMRSVDASVEGYVYYQGLSLSASATGLGYQDPVQAVSLYRIALTDLATAMARTVNFGVAALLDDAYLVGTYSRSQLSGNATATDNTVARLVEYLPNADHSVNLVSAIVDAQNVPLKNVVTRLDASGQVTASVELPALLSALKTLGGLGTFLETQPDAQMQPHAFYFDVASGNLTELAHDAYLDLAFDLPVGITTQLGTNLSDTLTLASVGTHFVMAGNGDDAIYLGTGKDIVGGGLGADTFWIGRPAEAEGDFINGGVERGTLDRLVFAPTESGMTLDLGKVSLSFVDAVQIGADRPGTTLRLSSAAGTADFNGNGVYGDMAVIPAISLSHGVRVSAAALTGGQSLYFGEYAQASFDGNDTVVGGVGDDRIVAGAGDDRLQGGVGADRLIGGLGADTFVCESGAELMGDQLDGTAERGTLDTLRIEAGALNQAFDLRLAASIQYIDQITFARDVGGQSLVLSGGETGIAAYANANGDGTAGDLLINASLDLKEGVVIDGSLLTATQSLQFNGARFGGNDVVTGGAGNDSFIYGGGVDTFTLGAGKDRVQIAAGAQGRLTLSGFSIAADALDTLDISALTGAVVTPSGSSDTLLNVVYGGGASTVQIVLQGITPSDFATAANAKLGFPVL